MKGSVCSATDLTKARGGGLPWGQGCEPLAHRGRERDSEDDVAVSPLSSVTGDHQAGLVLLIKEAIKAPCRRHGFRWGVKIKAR